MWINFRLDKISLFREFLGLFTKMNPREYFGKCLFAKWNPREMHTNILPKRHKLSLTQKVLKNASFYVKYLQNTQQSQSFYIWNNLISFEC